MRPGLLEGKSCVILGATGEVGRETALLFASEGASLLLSGRRAGVLSGLAEECRRRGARAEALQLDLSEPGAESVLAGAVTRAFGRLDVLISYVGYPLEPEIWYRGIGEVRADELVKILNVDLLSTFRAVRALLPFMEGGVLILTSSTPALSWYRYGSAYSIAKLAVVGLVRAVAAEYRRYKVRAYALALGNIKTSATYDVLREDEREALAEESPMGRWGEPSEVAKVALALASDLFSFVNGQVIVVDGGTLMLG
ncbi:MAG: SDR family oxidoreductase [Aigarchaeota archaeon]|nr:SDR family oxidoreductase [Aigarchaeota archaeon]MCS7127055.1 SDR family oxidoreductase [Candidatus Calditenuaceae archaeon]MCX8203958.1 SDR family oxidoreductase [Nitrososphaeria archaeon]MDW8043178.1 SDR family oxidoreductase [Nitrososphaerota archaeon]